MPRAGLILLDRDGVLNRLVIDPEHGTIDSPLHPGQVQVYPWVPEALRRLSEMGYGLSVVTNQPSAAKGKTTQANLESVHERVLLEAQANGGKILSSHICFHRAEDSCTCRKPKTGLLEDAFARNSGYDMKCSWMAGDGVTDVQAGIAFGVNTAFFGPKKCDACKVFNDMDLRPRFWGKDLLEFVAFLERVY